MNVYDVKNVSGLMTRLLGALAVAGLSVYAGAVERGDLKAFEGDGWHRWSVEAVENAPSWCCYTWHNKKVKSAACKLDEKINSYGSLTDEGATTAEEIQLFAKVEGGRVKEVRAFDSACPVTVQQRLVDHGSVNTAGSLSFLAMLLDGKQRLASQSIAAISVHESLKAQQILEATAAPARPVKLRKESIFWMGQVRAQQSLGILKRLMSDDELDKVREHAVFSVSQSNLPNRLDLIEEVARRDDSQKVRGQAWFWIAQTDDGDAERRIFAGMADESSNKVNEQAVFALSQLEGETGINALIRVIESREFNRSVRKQAMFWLAQSSSDQATDYLASVLDR